MTYPCAPDNNYNTVPVFPGLACWYAADKLFGPNSTLPSNGSTVNFWFDLSGNNAHLNTAEATFPKFVTNVQNGLPAVDFSQSTTAGILGLSNFIRADTFHYFCVVNLISTTHNNSYVVTPSDMSTNFNSSGTNITFNVFKNSGGSLNSLSLGTTFATGGQSIQFYQSASTQGITLSGTITNTQAISSIYNPAYPQNMILGTLLGNANSNFYGYICEVIGYSKSLAGTTQQTQILTYLQSKWSVT